MLGLCDAQVGDMQGAAFSGNPKQPTPQRVGDAGRRSQITHLREQSSALHVKDYLKSLNYSKLNIVSKTLSQFFVNMSADSQRRNLRNHFESLILLEIAGNL